MKDSKESQTPPHPHPPPIRAGATTRSNLDSTGTDGPGNPGLRAVGYNLPSTTGNGEIVKLRISAMRRNFGRRPVPI